MKNKKKGDRLMAKKGLYANIHAKRKRGGKCEKRCKSQKHLTLKAKQTRRLNYDKTMSKRKSSSEKKIYVYPSAYANAYASKICAGKIKDPSGVKRKDFKGRKKICNGWKN